MSWLRRCRHWIRERLHPRYRAMTVQEMLPEQLRKGFIYILEEDGYREQAAMLCPCGCRQVLHMNLLEDERPCWETVIHEDGTVSLHPSIWRKVGCKSHFWLRQGQVRWCDLRPSMWRRLFRFFER